MIISYIGLSHLSLNYSASSLIHKNKVQMLDEKEIIDNYLNKKFTIFEPGLEETQKKYKNSLTFSSDFNDLIKSDLVFIAVDVMTDNKNKVIYNRLNKLIKKTLNVIRLTKIPLIIMSQVEPGFTRSINYSKKYLYHYVETLVFGNALDRALNPERIIIGKKNTDSKTSTKLKSYLSKFKCEILEMSYEESELTKAFINIYLASQLITTNNLASIARALKCDWKIIKSALSLDKRIGKFSYINPGLGIAGGNIERDIKTLKDLSTSLDIKDNFFKFLNKDNKYYKDWLFLQINKYNLNKHKIGILGITYKEDTLSCKNAVSVNLIKKLEIQNVYLHDRRFKNLILSKKIKERFNDIKFILNNCEIIIILHKIKDYETIDLNNKKIKCIIDPFKITKGTLRKSKVKYLSLFD